MKTDNNLNKICKEIIEKEISLAKDVFDSKENDPLISFSFKPERVPFSIDLPACLAAYKIYGIVRGIAKRGDEYKLAYYPLQSFITLSIKDTKQLMNAVENNIIDNLKNSTGKCLAASVAKLYVVGVYRFADLQDEYFNKYIGNMWLSFNKYARINSTEMEMMNSAENTLFADYIPQFVKAEEDKDDKDDEDEEDNYGDDFFI